MAILVPVAPHSTHSHLARAAWLARRGDAELILLCVLPKAQRSKDDVVTREWLIELVAAQGVPIRTQIEYGDAAREILNTARREKTSLIVLGPDRIWHESDARQFNYFVTRSTLARVVQGAPCPIWVNRSQKSAESRISAMLCFLNLRLDCESLVHFAARISDECESQLVLFHNVNSPGIYAPGERHSVVEVQRYMIRTAERETERLKRLCSVNAPAVVVNGSDIQTLNAALTAVDTSMVIIDRVSPRWGDNSRIYEIIRGCPTPVLIRAETTSDHEGVIPRYRTPHSLTTIALLFAAMAIGVLLILLIMYLAAHTDVCHLDPARCQAEGDLFSSQGTSQGR